MAMMKNTILLMSCFAIVACDPTASGSESKSDPTAPAGSAPTMSAQYLFETSKGATPSLPRNSSLKFTKESDGSISVSGVAPKAAPGGTTQGAYFVIDENTETELSGKTIIVKVLARSATDAGTDMKVAYSTAEVGNSGWRTFTLTNQYQTFEFTYDVPAMKNGKKDYIGVLPVDEPVQILAVGIDAM